MPAAVTVGIGGIAFDVWCPGAELLSLPAHYRPFVGPRREGAEVIPVTVLEDPSPAGGADEVRLFTNPVWSIYGKGEEYRVVLAPTTARERSEFVARFTRAVPEVTIHCSGPFARPEPGHGPMRNPFCYPLDQILTIYALAHRGGLLVHASGVEISGRGYIFAGRSGSGKSTLSRLFAAGGAGAVLSDDRVAVRPSGAGHGVFGTPWAGSEGIAVNSRLPLSGMAFIGHGDENRIVRLTPAAAARRLYPVASIPWYDPPVLATVLDACAALLGSIPACEMFFRPGPEAVDLFMEFAGRS